MFSLSRISRASDVFSFGMVMLEMYTCKPLYPGMKHAQVQGTGPRKPPSCRGPTSCDAPVRFPWELCQSKCRPPVRQTLVALQNNVPSCEAHKGEGSLPRHANEERVMTGECAKKRVCCQGRRASADSACACGRAWEPPLKLHMQSVLPDVTECPWSPLPGDVHVADADTAAGARGHASGVQGPDGALLLI